MFPGTSSPAPMLPLPSYQTYHVTTLPRSTLRQRPRTTLYTLTTSARPLACLLACRRCLHHSTIPLAIHYLDYNISHHSTTPPPHPLTSSPHTTHHTQPLHHTPHLHLHLHRSRPSSPHVPARPTAAPPPLHLQKLPSITRLLGPSVQLGCTLRQQNNH
jgi:hypothetical protein